MKTNKEFIEKVDFKEATLFLRNDGVLHIHIKADADFELKDAVLIVEAMGRIGGGKKYPVLIDAGEYAHIDKEVRAFSADAISNLYTKADAIVYHSFAQKLIADFYISHNKPVVPTKCFSNANDALDWLLRDSRSK